jgi:hypothetical protein
MRLLPFKCPECGASPVRIIESVYAITCINQVGMRGEFEFDAEFPGKVLWDSAEPDVIDGKVTVYCDANHEWLAELTEPA